MRKLTVIAAGILLFATNASAQFGIKGGLNFNSFNDASENMNFNFQNSTGYHIGILYEARIPVLGMAVQPELLFMRSGVNGNVVNDFDEKRHSPGIYMDSFVLPVNLQIGLDLILLRPFITVAPYISYAISKDGYLSEVKWDSIHKFNYGVGIGAGLDIWKFQFMGKYNWDLAPIAVSDLMNGPASMLDNAKLKGFHISVAYIF